MGNRLYVGNLAYSTTEDGLAEAFGQAGNVVEVAVIMDRETGRSKGFAFVTMETDAEAAAAIEALDGKELDGRTLRVAEAKPREERGPRW
jgi:RNA recognition motif-containing protein